MTTEVMIGAISIASGFAGQALGLWHFRGRFEAKTEATEKDIAELKGSRSEMWGEINAHGERLAKVETACRIRHPQTTISD